MKIVVLVVATFVMVVTSVLIYWSPGRASPIVDDRGHPVPGSLSEKVRVPINGVQQGMIITSRNPSNPVLLFVHGGPGMPGYFLNDDYPTGLENDFTVAWWDQRGAGLSFDSDIPANSMTVEQFVQDTIAVTNYLRQRFGADKIYLMGHSWGSFIGIQAAAKAPELYHAYIGVGQVSYQLRSEQLSYDYLLERYRALGDTDMVHKLEAAPVTMSVPLPADYDKVRDQAMHQVGVGTTHDMTSVIWGIFIPSWRCRAYTLTEKLNLWRGKRSACNASLREELLTTDLTAKVPELKVPVYFLHGSYDYTVSYPMAQQYLSALKAPMKGFYTIDRSAHSPVYEQPDLTRRILRDDVLTGKTTLADRT